MYKINKRKHIQHDREHGKTQEYFKCIFSGVGKHKGKNKINSF